MVQLRYSLSRTKHSVWCHTLALFSSSIPNVHLVVRALHNLSTKYQYSGFIHLGGHLIQVVLSLTAYDATESQKVNFIQTCLFFAIYPINYSHFHCLCIITLLLMLWKEEIILSCTLNDQYDKDLLFVFNRSFLNHKISLSCNF